MSNQDKIQILRKIFGSSRQTGNEHLFHCPKCNHHKAKLSINVEKNKFKCWICEYSGSNLYRLIRTYGDFHDKRDWKSLDESYDLEKFDNLINDLLFDKHIDDNVKQTTSLPNEFVSLANKDLPRSSSPARKFLKKRGITDKDILYWKIGYCSSGPYKDRVVIPSFNDDGNVNYFVARTYVDDWKKYMNPNMPKSDMIFNHLYLDFDKELILTEGVFDAIVAGPNSIPILGSTLKKDSFLFKEIVRNDTPVYIALDPDAEKKALFLIKELLKYDVELYKIDINPYSDVGEMSKEEFQTRKAKANPVNSQNYLIYEIFNVDNYFNF